MVERRYLFIYDQETNNRLDLFLVQRLPEFSRSRLQKLIKEGYVIVDGEIPHKTGYGLEKGMQIELLIPQVEEPGLVPESIPLDIIFENQDILVINKPAGMVVHPAAGHKTGTLVHAVLAHVPDLEGVGGIKRPGIIHRLDKDTSGLIALAKNDRTHHWVQEQFKHRQVEKIYLALVDGRPPTPEGRIVAAIGRDPAHRKKMTVTQPGKGRDATSHYSTIENFHQHTYLEVTPLTGRTHQIRVHMNFIGCPVTGDSIYGRRKPTLPLNRHFLHAYRLHFIIPGEATPRSFEAPLPSELQQIINNLRQEII